MKIAQFTNNGFKILVEKFADIDYFVITLSLINVSIIHIKWLSLGCMVIFMCCHVS